MASRNTTVCALAICAIGLAAPSMLSADTINVPGDYTTIQEAIDAASVGDEIIVQPGTYNECIDLLGKAITLRALNRAVDLLDPVDPARASFIDGTGLDCSVVTCMTDEAPATVIDGFVIMGGTGTNHPIHELVVGGGVYIADSAPTVIGCVIVWNVATAGGGMLNERSSPTVTNCVFAENEGSDGSDDGFGGAMMNFEGSHPIVTGCLFETNVATLNGGAMLNVEFSDPLVTDCTFVSNATLGEGGAIFNDNSDPVLIDCTFVDNEAESGGAIWSYAADSMWVVNCSFIGNDVSEDGGAIYNDTSSPVVVNCGFSNNEAVFGGAIVNDNCTPLIINSTFNNNSALFSGGIRNWFGGTPFIFNCIFRGNADGEIDDSDGSVSIVSYCNVQGGHAGTGNIDDDPLFLRPASPGGDGEWGTPDDDYGDLRLMAGSPCIDAADSIAVPPDVLDLDGDGDIMEPIPFDFDGSARLVDDPETTDTGNGTPPIVDMGAHEFQVAVCTGDIDGDGDTDQSDLGILLASYELDGGGDLDGDGDTDQSDLGILLADYECPW